jgi:hypothetical protein
VIVVLLFLLLAFPFFPVFGILALSFLIEQPAEEIVMFQGAGKRMPERME